MPELLFQELAENAPVMIWRAGTDKLCNWFNRPWLDFTGRRIEQEVGYGWAEAVHREDFDRCVETYTAAFDAREKFSMVYRLRRHDGAYRWLLDNGAPYFRAGIFAGYFGSCVDITEQRDAHDLALRTLAERNILLREIYHRVKNNLQQIEGLIAIEASTLTDPKALDALEALTGRVRAMGAVHQRLIGSASLSDISARGFISDLCVDLARSQGADRRGVSIQVEGDAGVINIEYGVVLGLLINELVTNALKHAFPDKRAGEIIVSYERLGQQSKLEVRDNGVGLSMEAIDSSRPDHCGFRLIAGFVDQLNGHLTVDATSGTVIRVALPEPTRQSTQLAEIS
jgi:PAS domain S-box-containing protein